MAKTNGDGHQAEKGVIFDWGGVLMQTTDYTYRHYWDHKLGRAVGYTESVVHGVNAWRHYQLGLADEAEYITAVAEALEQDEDTARQILNDFYRGDHLNGPLIEAIREMQGRDGVRLGLMSNNIADLRAQLEALHVAELFDAIVISAEIGVMKPDRAAYHAVLRRLGLEATQAVFIDDALRNVEGARAVGMAALHYTPEADIITQIEAWLAM